MEIPLCGRRPRPARRRDGRRRRHFGVERHPRSGQLGVAGTRHADLRQHALRIRHDRSRAAAPARGDSGRRLPPHLHRSRSVGGTQDLPNDRRRQIGRLRLCQRPRSGLQRRFEESGAIPHRPPPASGREYAGAQNDAVEHRFLPRSAGLLAHQRHRAHGLPFGRNARRAARFRGRIDARRQLPHGAFHAENVPRRRSGGRGGLRTARSRGPHRRLGTAAGNGRSPVPCRDTRRSALDGRNAPTACCSSTDSP